MSVAEQIAAATQAREVVVEGMTWRLRQVKTEDVLRAGVALLLVLPSQIGELQKGLAEQAGEQAADLDAQLGAPTLDPATIDGLVDRGAESRRYTDGIVCAAVTGVRGAKGEMEDLRLVMNEAEQKLPESLWVESLPIEIRTGIVLEVVKQGGAARNAIATFRVRPEPRPGNGSAGPEVRPDAP